MGVSNSPAVSVIMPVLNGERFIADAIRSVRGQSVQVRELQVIDDGSTDNTWNIVQALADKDDTIRMYRGPQRGPGPARNVGLMQARGDVIAFLDSDDLWPEDKLQRQLDRLAAEPEVKMVGGLYQAFQDEPPGSADTHDGEVQVPELSWLMGPCVFKAEVFAQIGHFSEQLVSSEDMDFMMRFRETGMMYSILNCVTLYYRKHPNSMMAVAKPAHKREYQRALFDSLRRRKAKGDTHDMPPMRDFLDY